MAAGEWLEQELRGETSSEMSPPSSENIITSPVIMNNNNNLHSVLVATVDRSVSPLQHGRTTAYGVSVSSSPSVTGALVKAPSPLLKARRRGGIKAPSLLLETGHKLPLPPPIASRDKPPPQHLGNVEKHLPQQPMESGVFLPLLATPKSRADEDKPPPSPLEAFISAKKLRNQEILTNSVNVLTEKEVNSTGDIRAIEIEEIEQQILKPLKYLMGRGSVGDMEWLESVFGKDSETPVTRPGPGERASGGGVKCHLQYINPILR